MTPVKDPLLPKLAERVMLVLVQKDDRQEKMSSPPRVFYTNVQDEQSGLLGLAVPMASTHYVVVPEGQTVVLGYVRQDAAYRVAGKVEKVDMKAKTPLLWVAARGQVHRVQRRQYVRVPVNLPVAFKLLPEDGGSESETKQEGVLRDISGGGVMLRTAVSLQPDQKIKMEIKLDRDLIFVTGQVVRVGPRGADGKEDERSYGIQFVDISTQVREVIVKFIFAEQRRQLQREQQLGG